MATRQASENRHLMKGFGGRLRLLREAHGARYPEQNHTKARWARLFEVSPAMYGRWEAGANLPQFFDLIRISLMFNVDPNYLMEGVLSDYMPVWLYRALKAGPQELLDEADYWKRGTFLDFAILRSSICSGTY